MMPAMHASIRSEFKSDNYLGNGNSDAAVFINASGNLVYAICHQKHKQHYPYYKEIEVLAAGGTGANAYRLTEEGLEYRKGSNVIRTDP